MRSCEYCMSRIGRSLVALVALVSVQCVDEGLPATGVQGEFVRIYHDEEMVLCGGTLAYMDSFVDVFSETFAISPLPVDVYWVKDASGDESYSCAEGAPGCYQSDKMRVVTSRVPHGHELAHALLVKNGLTPGSAIDEGLAHLFEENHWWSTFPLEVPIAAVLDYQNPGDGSFPVELRGRASHFLGFIYNAYGIEALRALVRERVGGRSRAVQSKIFLDVTGDDFDTVLERYAAAPECSLPEVRVALVACSQESKPWSIDEDEWSALITLGCGRADTIGSSSGAMWTTRSFDVDEPGEFELFAPGSPNDALLIEIGRCGSTCEDPFFRTMRPGAPERVELGSGRYYTTFYRLAKDPGEIGLTVRRIFP